jgi:hypothetical protein
MNNIIKNFSVIICLSVLFVSEIHSDVIKLRNGKTIEAEEIWEEDGIIKYRRYGGILGIPKNLVENIQQANENQNSEQFISAIESLTPNYKGDDPVDLFDKLEKLDKSRERSEYETSAQYNSRLVDIGMSSIINKTYIFKDDPPMEYYADKSILEITPIPWLKTIEKERSQYVGSNAFGVKKIVTSYRDTKYRLEFINEKSMTKIVGSDEGYFNSPLIKLYLAPSKAKNIKQNIRLLYVCRPVPFHDEDHSRSSLPNPYTSTNYHGSGATIDSPTSFFHTYKDISVEIMEVIVFNDSTGEILKKFGPF